MSPSTHVTRVGHMFLTEFTEIMSKMEIGPSSGMGYLLNQIKHKTGIDCENSFSVQGPNSPHLMFKVIRDFMNVGMGTLR